MAAAGYVSPPGTVYNIGLLPGESPLTFQPSGTVTPVPPLQAVGAGSQFIGAQPNNNATSVAPGSFVIKNNAHPNNIASAGGSTLADLTNGIMSQLASYAIQSPQQNIVNAGGGDFFGGVRSINPTGIAGSGAKFYG